MKQTLGVAVVAVLLAGAPAVRAQQPTPGAAQPQTAPPSGAPQTQRVDRRGGDVIQTVVSDDDAERTRERLRQFLRQYPPSLADVLRLDPTLLGNDAYLAPYPELVAFLRQHPNVIHNPTYFVGASRAEWNPAPPGRDAMRAMDDVFAGLFVLTGLMTLMALIGWTIKKFVDHRRWLRTIKTQTDAHAKVFDRLSSSEDFLAYVQSPAGQKFLESAPIAVDEARSLGAPVGRILFTAQAGTVVGFVGVALAYASSHLGATVPDFSDATPFFFTASVLAIALGIGLIVSSGVAYLLSRRLGLLEERSSHA